MLSSFQKARGLLHERTYTAVFRSPIGVRAGSMSPDVVCQHCTTVLLTASYYSLLCDALLSCHGHGILLSRTTCVAGSAHVLQTLRHPGRKQRTTEQSAVFAGAKKYLRYTERNQQTASQCSSQKGSDFPTDEDDCVSFRHLLKHTFLVLPPLRWNRLGMSLMSFLRLMRTVIATAAIA